MIVLSALENEVDFSRNAERLADTIERFVGVLDLQLSSLHDRLRRRLSESLEARMGSGISSLLSYRTRKALPRLCFPEPRCWRDPLPGKQRPLARCHHPGIPALSRPGWRRRRSLGGLSVDRTRCTGSVRLESRCGFPAESRRVERSRSSAGLRSWRRWAGTGSRPLSMTFLASGPPSGPLPDCTRRGRPGGASPERGARHPGLGRQERPDRRCGRELNKALDPERGNRRCSASASDAPAPGSSTGTTERV